jgi:hypothetical protein
MVPDLRTCVGRGADSTMGAAATLPHLIEFTDFGDAIDWCRSPTDAPLDRRVFACWHSGDLADAPRVGGTQEGTERLACANLSAGSKSSHSSVDVPRGALWFLWERQRSNEAP